MSDNFQRYNCIKKGLMQLLPKRLSGRELQRLDELAKLVNGIVASSHSQLPKIALKDPTGIKTESKVVKLKRLITNDNFTAEVFWLPFVRQFLTRFAQAKQPLLISIDGSPVGRGCMALVVSLVYGGRCLPLVWLVVAGNKGHLGQDVHLQLLHTLKPLLPTGVGVVLLGDGEFDGTWVQYLARENGWDYVVRTAKNSLYCTPRTKAWRSFRHWRLRPGDFVVKRRIGFSGEGYGPVTAVGWWERGWTEPIYLLTNLADGRHASDLYKRRFRIECFFSDQKVRGFRLNQSHLSCPERLNRLLIGCVFAYWWLVALGTYARFSSWDKIVHRTERQDLSFFQLGWRLLEHWQNIEHPLSFVIEPLPQFRF